MVVTTITVLEKCYCILITVCNVEENFNIHQEFLTSFWGLKGIKKGKEINHGLASLIFTVLLSWAVISLKYFGIMMLCLIGFQPDQWYKFTLTLAWEKESCII